MNRNVRESEFIKAVTNVRAVTNGAVRSFAEFYGAGREQSVEPVDARFN
jgi:hypothetical protein